MLSCIDITNFKRSFLFSLLIVLILFTKRQSNAYQIKNNAYQIKNNAESHVNSQSKNLNQDSNKRRVAIGIYQDVRVFQNIVPSIKTYIIDPLLKLGYNVDIFICLASRFDKQPDLINQNQSIIESLRYHNVLQYLHTYKFYKYKRS